MIPMPFFPTQTFIFIKYFNAKADKTTVAFIFFKVYGGFQQIRDLPRVHLTNV